MSGEKTGWKHCGRHQYFMAHFTFFLPQIFIHKLVTKSRQIIGVGICNKLWSMSDVSGMGTIRWQKNYTENIYLHQHHQVPSSSFGLHLPLTGWHDENCSLTELEDCGSEKQNPQAGRVNLDHLIQLCAQARNPRRCFMNRWLSCFYIYKHIYQREYIKHI